MKFLIVDDHAVVREGVAAVLRGAGGEVTVLQAADTETGLALARDHADLDAVLLDLRMPGVGGFAGVEAFGRQCPQLPVIVLSSSEDPADVRGALALGALGYVPKSADSGTLLAALRLVMAGEVYVPPFVIGGIRPARKTGDTGLAALTQRQREVLDLLGTGIANKEIAARLMISEKTVKAHVSALFATLGVSSRAQAAILVREQAR